MPLTVKVTCNRCGETVEVSLAMHHLCRRLTLPDVELLIDKFLDDLNDRSGFTLPPTVREVIRGAWRGIATRVFNDLETP
jgi:hypothetical protein